MDQWTKCINIHGNYTEKWDMSDYCVIILSNLVMKLIWMFCLPFIILYNVMYFFLSHTEKENLLFYNFDWSSNLHNCSRWLPPFLRQVLTLLVKRSSFFVKHDAVIFYLHCGIKPAAYQFCYRLKFCSFQKQDFSCDPLSNNPKHHMWWTPNKVLLQSKL